MVLSLCRKASPPKWSEERQGSPETQPCPNCPRPGVTQWLLGRRQPRRPSWGRRTQQDLQRWTGRGDEGGWEGGPWAAALRSGATRSSPRRLPDSCGALGRPLPSLDLTSPLCEMEVKVMKTHHGNRQGAPVRMSDAPSVNERAMHREWFPRSPQQPPPAWGGQDSFLPKARGHLLLVN